MPAEPGHDRDPVALCDLLSADPTTSATANGRDMRRLRQDAPRLPSPRLLSGVLRTPPPADVRLLHLPPVGGGSRVVRGDGGLPAVLVAGTHDPQFHLPGMRADSRHAGRCGGLQLLQLPATTATGDLRRLQSDAPSRGQRARRLSRLPLTRVLAGERRASGAQEAHSQTTRAGRNLSSILRHAVTMPSV